MVERVASTGFWKAFGKGCPAADEEDTNSKGKGHAGSSKVGSVHVPTIQ